MVYVTQQMQPYSIADNNAIRFRVPHTGYLWLKASAWYLWNEWLA
jgi:hypothetical protein